MRYLLYCIFRSPEFPGVETIGGAGEERVFLVSHRHLHAVLSRLGSERLGADVPRLMNYEKVIEACHRKYPTIPMRYGCLFHAVSQVRSLLEQRRRQYEALLEELEGCVEMGLRILLPEEVSDSHAPAEPAGEARGASGANLPLAPGGSGHSYLAAQRRRYLAQDEAARSRGLMAARICRAFTGLFSRHRQESRQLAGARLLSLYFLVPRGKLEPFRQAFRGVSARVSGQFLLSGPWPPYNFVLPRSLGHLQEIE